MAPPSSKEYVAELALPAPVYAPAGERNVLPQPGYYGASRGYWGVHLVVQHPSIEGF